MPWSMRYEALPFGGIRYTPEEFCKGQRKGHILLGNHYCEQACAYAYAKFLKFKKNMLRIVRSSIQHYCIDSQKRVCNSVPKMSLRATWTSLLQIGSERHFGKLSYVLSFACQYNNARCTTGCPNQISNSTMYDSYVNWMIKNIQTLYFNRILFLGKKDFKLVFHEIYQSIIKNICKNASIFITHF